MGLHHDRANGGGAGIFPYANGFQDPPYFRTVMAYACTAAPCPRIAHFSNPRIAYQGRPTGIPDSEDSARSLGETALYVANFRPSVHESQYPSLFTIDPDWSRGSGGAEATLRGLGFRAGSRVLFDGVDSPLVTVVDNRTIRAVVPAGRAGLAEVSVVAPDGASVISRNAFAYYHDLPVRFLTGGRGGPGHSTALVRTLASISL